MIFEVWIEIYEKTKKKLGSGDLVPSELAHGRWYFIDCGILNQILIVWKDKNNLVEVIFVWLISHSPANGAKLDNFLPNKLFSLKHRVDSTTAQRAGIGH